jgi:hypothetical protein
MMQEFRRVKFEGLGVRMSYVRGRAATAMDPLAVVEAQLGIVDIWPSYVLRDMFVWEPNSRVIKKIAAFMYGNSLRLSYAGACYNACNGRHQSRVETVLKTLYNAWDSDENGRQMEQYYSMSMKCQALINGKACEQYEAVKPVVSVSEFGPPRTRHPGQIASMTESIRSVE